MIILLKCNYCITKKSRICKTCINNFCTLCNLPLKKMASICCVLCNNWIHLKCSGLKRLQFEERSSSDKTLYCKNCFSDIFPFHSIDNPKLNTTMQPPTNRSKSPILFKQTETPDNTYSVVVRQQTKVG